MALMAFSLINDSSNFFTRGSNSGDALALSRSGSVLILCQQNNDFRTALQMYKESNVYFIAGTSP